MTFHARRFDRAAASYDAHSAVQDRMAEALLSLLPAEGGDGADAPPRIFEIGCGTGRLTRRLLARFPQGNFLVTDAAPSMLRAARASVEDSRPPRGARSGVEAHAAEAAMPAAGRKLQWALFDAEGRAPMPEAVAAEAPFDLAAGNALVQWFPDLAGHFRFIAGILAMNGRYLLSGFSDGNFPELNAILAAPPFSYRHFPGHGTAEVRRAAETAGFETAALHEEVIETRHAAPRDFLHVIRGLGSARKPEEGKALTRARLETLEATYRARYGSGDGVKATWRPWYALLRKR